MIETMRPCAELRAGAAATNGRPQLAGSPRSTKTGGSGSVRHLEAVLQSLSAGTLSAP